MTSTSDVSRLILPAWETNARVTSELVQAIPAQIYKATIPGAPRRTVRAMAVHLHNSRCRWLRTLGQPLGIRVPRLLHPESASKAQLRQALRVSAAGMRELLALACEQDGQLPATARYVWRNLALDAGHILTYFVGHEAHHRGQLSLIARQLGHDLPRSSVARLWWWKPPPARGRGTRRAAPRPARPTR